MKITFAPTRGLAEGKYRLLHYSDAVRLREEVAAGSYG